MSSLISLLFFMLAGCKSDKASEAIASAASQATIVGTTPFNASLSEPINRKITATFNSSMDPETIEAIMPADLSSEVARNSGISITFDDVMDPTTFKSSRLIVTGPDSVPVAGTVTYSNTTASFRPKDMLAMNAAYTVSLESGAKDLAGNSVLGTPAWSFTTGSVSAAGPLPVGKGSDFDHGSHGDCR